MLCLPLPPGGLRCTTWHSPSTYACARGSNQGDALGVVTAFRAHLSLTAATAATRDALPPTYLRNMMRSDVRVMSQRTWVQALPGGCLVVDPASAASCLSGTMRHMLSTFDSFYRVHTGRRYALKWLLNAGSAVVAATLPTVGGSPRRVLVHCSTIQAVILRWFHAEHACQLTFQAMVDRVASAGAGTSLGTRRCWTDETGRPVQVESPSAVVKQHVADALLSLTASQHPVRPERGRVVTHHVGAAASTHPLDFVPAFTRTPHRF